MCEGQPTGIKIALWDI